MIGLLIFLLIGLLLMVGILVLLLRADATIKDIYATDRQRWRQLGSPTGYFWRPDEIVPFWQSVSARDSICYDAAFSPDNLRRSTSDKPHTPPSTAQSPNKALEPTPTSVTSPAAQEPRQP